MSSAEKAREAGFVAEAELDGRVVGPAGSMLFRKSSTVLVGTGILELLSPLEDAIGAAIILAICDSTLDADFCCFNLRVA